MNLHLPSAEGQQIHIRSGSSPQSIRCPHFASAVCATAACHTLQCECCIRELRSCLVEPDVLTWNGCEVTAGLRCVSETNFDDWVC